MKIRYRPSAKKQPVKTPVTKTQQPFIKQQGGNVTHESFFHSVPGVASPQFHTDERAAALAEQVHAKAFTIGTDIFFNKNQYQPHSAEGKKLIAHEMVHATQHQHIPGIKRKPKEDTEEEKIEGRRARKSHSIFWNDLNNNFPDAGRKLTGSHYDKNIDYLKPDFTEGVTGEKNTGHVHTVAPCMVIGKKYADEADEKIRTGFIPPQMAIIDEWRFANFRINDVDLDTAMETKLKNLSLAERKTWEEKLPIWTAKTKQPTDKILGFLLQKRVDDFEISDADMASPLVIKKLNTLNAQKLLDYKTKAIAFGTSSKLSTAGVVQKIGELLSAFSLKKTSTPLQTNATVVTDVSGDIEKQVIQLAPNIRLEILPDEWTDAVAKGGETSMTDNIGFKKDRKNRTSYSVNSDATGALTSITDSNNNNKVVTLPQTIIFTIQTRYAKGVDITENSSYGRGKASSDVAAGNTSLQFHEGNHGIDFVNGLTAITYPASLDYSKMTVNEFINMMTEAGKLGEASRLATDEAGEYGQEQYKKDHPND